MKNLDIRLMVSENCLHYREIAEYMNVTPTYLSKIMARDLKPEMKIRIVAAIQGLVKIKNDV